MARIALRDVWKKFNTVQALQGLEFETREGELFCLLGPSGAGKTTTLRIIAGIEQPDRGEVLMNDESIVDLMPKERDVALAFESYALYPQFTVYENLAFPLNAPIRKKQLTAVEVQGRVTEVASLLGISDLLKRFPRELSGGQRQRVGLGRALVRKPKIYLLDEPIAHLDAKLRHRMRGELKKIQADLGITTIYSTPDQLEALSMADTVAVINQGKIEQIGPPKQIFHFPDNVFVAQLVGDPRMNILESRIEDGALVVTCDVNFRIPIPADAPQAVFDADRKGKVLVGIRPKDISFVSKEGGTFHTRGRIRDVDILGQTAVANVEVGCLEMKVKLATSEAPERESLVSMTLDTTHLHYFDAETRTRIK
jgi:multiple sugar transport system ATP-binding protein